MNFRFVELASILEPGRAPKTDKSAILVDAVRMVTQLRTEAKKLKDSNSDLQEKIKELKVIPVSCLFPSSSSAILDLFIFLEMAKIYYIKHSKTTKDIMSTSAILEYIATINILFFEVTNLLDLCSLRRMNSGMRSRG